jgi:hypothetical protein
MRKEIARGVIFMFSLVLMSSLVLGVTATTAITDVKITSVSQPNTDYAIVNINASITDAYQVDYLILHYKLLGSSEEKIALSSNGQMSFVYPNSRDGIKFDYQIQAFYSVSYGGNLPYFYYPTTGWVTYNNGNAVNTNTSPSQTTSQVTTSPITGKTVSNNTNVNTNINTNTNSSGVLVNFAKTTAGKVSIIFVALVLVIIMVRVSRNKKDKIQNTAEVVVENKSE